MSSKMLLEIHVLQNFAPSCLNRDELNFPKEALFGGVRRARISSQCLKRATRMNDEFRSTVGLSFGLRTRKLHKEVAEDLKARGLSEAEVERASKNVFTLLNVIFKKHADGSQTQAAQFADSSEIKKLADLALGLDDKLKDLEEGLTDEERAASDEADASVEELKETQADIEAQLKEIKKQIKDKSIDEATRKELQNQEKNLKIEKSEITKTIKVSEEKAKKLSPLRAEVVKIFGRGKETGTVTVKAVDIALFGRMIAEIDNANVDAASQVAHAISTHEAGSEEDFWSMVDDLNKPGEDRGAGLINTQQFNSATFYRYANVHVPQLCANLGGDAELARQAAMAFARAFITAIPAAKQNSHAALNPPDLVLVVVREKGQALSLANAFAKPISAGREGDIVGSSAQAMADYWERILKAYGDAGIAAAPFFTVTPEADDVKFAKGDRVQGIDALMTSLAAALARFECKEPRA